jgi:hypothetical protein
MGAAAGRERLVEVVDGPDHDQVESSESRYARADALFELTDAVLCAAALSSPASGAWRCPPGR